jgi:radical SAM-linked protein
MRRALLRAGVELKYSEGFNPHPYISVALPLPVGYESTCELLDFSAATGIPTDGLADLITAALPEGLSVEEAYISGRRFGEIAWVGTTGLLHYEPGAAPDAAHELKERFDADSIVIAKKTKRGVSDIDIAPFIRDIGFTPGDTVAMRVKLSAQDPSVSPGNLMGALSGPYERIAPVFASFARREVYDREMSVFR